MVLTMKNLSRHEVYDSDAVRRKRAAEVHSMYVTKRLRRRARRMGDIAAALGIVTMLAAAISLLFIFLWAGFDPGLVSGWIK